MPETPPPLRYAPAFEVAEPDEVATDDALDATLRGIAETTFADSGHATRGVHAKGHGLLVGELRVLDGLPPALAQGMFATPARYPVAMRLSTIPGDILADSVSTPRGLAIKVIGVPGERLPGSESEVTQDFVLVNGPAFNAPNAKAFLSGLKLLAATTDKAEGLKKAASATARAAESVLEAFGSKSVKLVTMGGQPATHILGETFYSQVPLLYGPYMAKICVAPVAPALTALTGGKLDLAGHPDAQREAVVDFFRAGAAEWELRVQLCTELETMPIEDASVVWPEDRSPYVAVARLVAALQEAWTEARIAAIEEGMAFTPWHGLAAHRPLGSVMRARRTSYEKSARFRAERNGRPIREPRGAADLPA